MSELTEIISDWVRAAILRHSGGVKFTELLVEFAAEYHAAEYHLLSQKSSPATDADLPQLLENTIRDMKDVKILDYTWHMSDEFHRAKMFVYTE